MFTLKRTSCLAALILSVLATSPPASRADDGNRRHRRPYAEVEIESLRADLRYIRGNWRLAIRYDIEIEDAQRRDRFDLVLRVLERGRPLLDRRGRPLTFVLRLDRPTEIDRDEVTFRRQVIIPLPDGSFRNPKRLRLVAEVVRPYDGRVLDRRKDRIRFRRGHRSPIIDGRYASCPRWPRWSR